MANQLICAWINGLIDGNISVNSLLTLSKLHCLRLFRSLYSAKLCQWVMVLWLFRSQAIVRMAGKDHMETCYLIEELFGYSDDHK